MAILKANVLGKISGRVGLVYGRIRSGINIICSLPSCYSIPNDDASKLRRSRFAVTFAYTKAVYAIDMLREIWKWVTEAPLTVPNTIFHHNYRFTTDQLTTSRNLLVPDGFPLPVLASTIAADVVTIELNPLNTAAEFSAEEVNLSAAAVLCCSAPTDTRDNPYEFIPLHSDIEDFDFTQSYELNLALTPTQQAKAARYTSKMVYAAVASRNALNEIVQISSTYFKQG